MVRRSWADGTRRGMSMIGRGRVVWLAVVVGLCVLPASAPAHTVMSGESLSSVAAANGLTTDELAAANGLSPDAPLIEGEPLFVPYPSGASDGASSGGGGGDTGGGGGGSVGQPGATHSRVPASPGPAAGEVP